MQIKDHFFFDFFVCVFFYQPHNYEIISNFFFLGLRRANLFTTIDGLNLREGEGVAFDRG